MLQIRSKPDVLGFSQKFERIVASASSQLSVLSFSWRKFIFNCRFQDDDWVHQTNCSACSHNLSKAKVITCEAEHYYSLPFRREEEEGASGLFYRCCFTVCKLAALPLAKMPVQRQAGSLAPLVTPTWMTATFLVGNMPPWAITPTRRNQYQVVTDK